MKGANILPSEPQALPLALGTVVKPYGKIGAVMFTGGERYYMLTNGNGDTALMPWFVIEGNN